PDGRRHDRSARFGHRRGNRTRIEPISDRAAAEVRNGHRESAVERRARRSRRPDGTRHGYRAPQLQRRGTAAALTMSDLFDLPFEEEPQAETEAREAALVPAPALAVRRI